MSGFRIDVSDLLTHPGARRPVSLAEELEGLAGSAARATGAVRLELTLERIPDGIVVRGDVQADWAAQCSVCLRDLERTLELHVDELFESAPVEGETYPIEGYEIDLEQLVRDNVLLELPLAPHCDDDCRPDIELDAEDAPDPRWAALGDLASLALPDQPPSISNS
jgi:uncharacterized protein